MAGQGGTAAAGASISAVASFRASSRSTPSWMKLTTSALRWYQQAKSRSSSSAFCGQNSRSRSSRSVTSLQLLDCAARARAGPCRPCHSARGRGEVRPRPVALCTRPVSRRQRRARDVPGVVAYSLSVVLSYLPAGAMYAYFQSTNPVLPSQKSLTLLLSRTGFV